ncbi:MAG: Holliday junction resolvase RuvX [Bacillota bacterium]
MRILGLDPGEKRIGVAISDPLGITAQGLEVISFTDIDQALNRIDHICLDYSVQKIVVGNPLKMSGSKGSASEQAEKFADSLSSKTGLPVEMLDERLTSGSAEKTLIAGGASRKKRRRVKDKLAAVLILEQYLALKDSRKNRGANSDR